jgi:hypothetical protein
VLLVNQLSYTPQDIAITAYVPSLQLRQACLVSQS